MKGYRIFVFALIALGFISCKKDERVFTDPQHERSFLHLVQASNAFSLTDFHVDYLNGSDVVIQDVYYNRNWPVEGYADVLSAGEPDQFGNNLIYFYITDPDTMWGYEDTLMTPRTVKFDAGKKYSLFVTDSAGLRASVLFEDAYPGVTDSTINVRFINMDETNNSSRLARIDTGTTYITPSVLFMDDSQFFVMDTGTHTFSAVYDSTGGNVSTINQRLLSGTYTFYLGSAGDLKYYKNE